jgi:aryl-alcohol dehydrogenase-like predicted oxidoreductase
MRYRTWGSTGLRVSELALGTVELGLDYGIAATGERLRPTEEEAAALLNGALDLGINVIDTARAYGDAEAIIGRALAERRREFVLVTKAVSGEVEQSLEASLRALRTDHVDVLLLHCRAEEQPSRTEELERIVARGLARFVGVSIYGVAIPAGFDCAQVAWNVLDRRAEGCAGALMARSVLLRGALSFRYRHLPESLSPVRSAIGRLEALGMALPELAYRYVLSGDSAVTALVGTGRREELEQCCAYAARGPLPEDMLRAIRRVEVDTRLLDLSRWPAF